MGSHGLAESAPECHTENVIARGWPLEHAPRHRLMRMWPLRNSDRIAPGLKGGRFGAIIVISTKKVVVPDQVVSSKMRHSAIKVEDLTLQTPGGGGERAGGNRYRHGATTKMEVRNVTVALKKYNCLGLNRECLYNRASTRRSM